MTASDLHDFWAWWLGRKDRLDEAIWAGTFDEQIDEITTALGKVDERLGWELAPGEGSRNHLIITAGGDPEVRPSPAPACRCAGCRRNVVIFRHAPTA